MAPPKKKYCKRGHPRTPDNVDKWGVCRICNLLQASKWAKDNPEKTRTAGRKYDRKVRLEQFGLMPEDAPHTCQVCGRDNGSKKLVCVDHDHTTGKFRGFLCDRCNKVLGFVKDDPNLLEKLALYLREKI